MPPKPVEFPRKIVRRHVVLRAPQSAGIFEPQFPRPLIRELDETHKVFAHGLGDFVPACPGLVQFIGVAAAGHEASDVLNIQALVLAGRAPLSLAVGALHAGSNLGDLRAQAGIRGRGQDEGNFQDQQLASQVGGQLQPVEAGGLLRQIHLRGNRPLVRLGREDFRVVGDVGSLYPIGPAGVNAQFQQLGLGVLDEGFRLCDRWRLVCR